MKELDFIQDTLNALAPFVREKYAQRGSVAVSSKSKATDLLTEVDVAVQQRTAELLAEAYPDDLFIAEEEGLGLAPDDPGRRCWVMDPVDGTQNFVRGLFPSFGISLAFAVGGEAVAGGVAFPVPEDLFLAERGAGAYRNGTRLAVSDTASVDLAWVEVDLGGPKGRKPTLDLTYALMDQAGAIRCHCAAVVGLCSVATGDMDAYVHIGLHPWDFAAAQLIAQEAGAKTSCIDGSPLTLFGPMNGVVATNGLIHEELLGILTPA